MTEPRTETDAPRCEGLAPFHCGNPTCPVHAEPATDDGERRPFDPALDMNTVDPFSRVADFSLECETLRVVKFEPAPADSDGDQW